MGWSRPNTDGNTDETRTAGCRVCALSNFQLPASNLQLPAPNLQLPASHLSTFIALLLLLAVAPACRVSRQVVPEPVQFIGVGFSADLVAPTTRTVARSVTASGEAAAPALAMDSVQGRLVATQAARQAARRELARKIEAMETKSGKTVGEVIRRDRDKRQKMEELLLNAKRTGLTKNERGKYAIIMSLDLQALNKILAPDDRLAALPGVSTAPRPSREQIRKRVEQEALANAQVRALDFVKALRLSRYETLGAQMSKNVELDRGVRQLVAAAPARSVRFHDSGTCEVAIVIDLADIRRLAIPPRKVIVLPFGLTQK